MAYMHKETFVISHSINSVSNPDDYFEIDDMIALTVQLLNRKGYLTTHCCSGHMFPDLASINNLYEDSYNDDCYISFVEGISLPKLPPEFYISSISFSTDDKFAFPNKHLTICKDYDTDDARETMRCIFETMEQLYEWVLTLPEFSHKDEKLINIEKTANKKITIDDVMKIAQEHIKSNELDMTLTSAEYVSDSNDTKLILYFTTECEPDVPKEWAEDWDWPLIDAWWEFACDLVSIFGVAVKLTRVQKD